MVSAEVIGTSVLSMSSPVFSIFPDPRWVVYVAQTMYSLGELCSFEICDWLWLPTFPIECFNVLMQIVYILSFAFRRVMWSRVASCSQKSISINNMLCQFVRAELRRFIFSEGYKLVFWCLVSFCGTAIIRCLLLIKSHCVYVNVFCVSDISCFAVSVPCQFWIWDFA